MFTRLALIAAVVASVGAAPCPAMARPGDLDPSFGEAGEITSPFNSGSLATEVDSAGHLLVFGTRHMSEPGIIVPAVIRYDAAGALDSTFGDRGRTVLPVDEGSTFFAGFILAPDGGAIVSLRTVSTVDRAEYLSVFRLTPAGGLDGTFGRGGVLVLPLGVGAKLWSGQLFLRPNGRIEVVALECTEHVGCTLEVSRVSLAGEILSQFRTHDAFEGFVEARAALQPDDRLVLAIRVYEDDAFLLRLVRYDSFGRLDHSFGTFGRLQTDIPLPDAPIIALAPDGRIVVAGREHSTTIVARSTRDGNLDRTFGVNGQSRLVRDTPENLATALSVTQDGQVLIAGAAGSFSQGLHWFISALGADGALNTEFGSAGSAIRDSGGGYVTDLLLQPDGRIVAAGFTERGAALVRYVGFPRICADANGDASITVSDGVQVLRAAAGLASSCLSDFCDVDGNGAVTITDGVRTLRAAAGLATDLACQSE